MDLKPIRTEADHATALAEIEHLWDAPEGNSAADRLEVLAMLVEAYEKTHFPIDAPDPVVRDLAFPQGRPDVPGTCQHRRIRWHRMRHRPHFSGQGGARRLSGPGDSTKPSRRGGPRLGGGRAEPAQRGGDAGAVQAVRDRQCQPTGRIGLLPRAVACVARKKSLRWHGIDAALQRWKATPILPAGQYQCAPVVGRISASEHLLEHGIRVRLAAR